MSALVIGSCTSRTPSDLGQPDGGRLGRLSILSGVSDMDIERERNDLQRYSRGHRQRINHLQARLHRTQRELRVHEMISDLAGDSRLPDLMRGLAETSHANPRSFLADHGLQLPEEVDLKVENVNGDLTVRATYRDDWFPADLSWSAGDGFQGRVVNNSWRHARTADAAEG
jgi:hypothetical protein